MSDDGESIRSRLALSEQFTSNFEVVIDGLRKYNVQQYKGLEAFKDGIVTSFTQHKEATERAIEDEVQKFSHLEDRI